MKYIVSESIFNHFPNFSRAVIIARGIKNLSVCDELYNDFQQIVHETYINSDLNVNHPNIKIWREVYKSFPSKSSDLKPSIEALIKRIKKGEGAKIPFINSIVCISNMVSIKYLFPSGLIDLARIKGDLCLDYAEGNEIFRPFGKEEVLNPAQGEVIYYDNLSKIVLCGSWNSRGGKDTMIMPETEDVVIDIDSIIAGSESLTAQQSAVDLMVNLIQQYCGGKVTTHYLNQHNSEFTL